jgi:altronate hydrolase
VGCVNKIAEKITDLANKEFAGKSDGVFTFSHPYGCSQLGEDHKNTQTILKGLVQHPNAGAVLILGLGCENNNIKEFKKVLGPVDETRIRFLESQSVEDEITEALKIIGEMADITEKDLRRDCDLSELIIGLKCGGSDGLSGITANPLLGTISNKVIDQGGTSLLTEVPEMFGAEKLLMNRAANQEVFEKTVSLINNFKDYFKRYNQVVYENPSPGNKEGGITTLEDKSLGCTQKGGDREVRAVLQYGKRVSTRGLNLLDGPGNDIVAVTNLAASGAQIVLFTTGRGTPLGGPVPTVKISSNSELAGRKRNWIDFNAGVLTEGTAMEDLSEEFLTYILEVASGKQTLNEINDYREIAIFKDGVTL